MSGRRVDAERAPGLRAALRASYQRQRPWASADLVDAQVELTLADLTRVQQASLLRHLTKNPWPVRR